jgi:hypothetical protein
MNRASLKDVALIVQMFADEKLSGAFAEAIIKGRAGYRAYDRPIHTINYDDPVFGKLNPDLFYRIHDDVTIEDLPIRRKGIHRVQYEVIPFPVYSENVCGLVHLERYISESAGTWKWRLPDRPEGLTFFWKYGEMECQDSPIRALCGIKRMRKDRESMAYIQQSEGGCSIDIEPLSLVAGGEFVRCLLVRDEPG